MKVTICIGSYCHVKGAPQVIAELQRLVEEAGVKDYVELAGKFCMKRCQEGNAQGVNIDIDGVPYDLKPSDSVKRGASRAGIAREAPFVPENYGRNRRLTD